MSSKIPRLSIDKEFHSDFDSYTKKKKDGLTFHTMAELFLLAAVHGYQEGNYRPFKKESKTATIFEWTVFGDEQLHIIRCICVLHNKKDPRSAEVLMSTQEMADIIEGYANGGFRHLLQHLNRTEDAAGNLLALIVKSSKS